MTTATAQANPNIAFIKYWGNRDPELRIPTNPSLSMNLDGLFTRTRVSLKSTYTADSLLINGSQVNGEGLSRVSGFLDLLRTNYGINFFACVESQNNFPTGAGIASSASAFAALALAASTASGLHLSEIELSRLARRGSGSACRSIPTGFVEWKAGTNDKDSYAFSIAGPDYWDLVDCIAVVSTGHKPTGSTQGHALADSSPLQAKRVVDAPRRLETCRNAILDRDFAALAEVVEQDSDMMHAVMQSSIPPLMYWLPATREVMRQVQAWRASGLPVCYTIDAGPNVHVLTLAAYAPEVVANLNAIQGVRKVISAQPGGPAHLVDT